MFCMSDSYCDLEMLYIYGTSKAYTYKCSSKNGDPSMSYCFIKNVLFKRWDSRVGECFAGAPSGSIAMCCSWLEVVGFPIMQYM